MSSQVSSSPEKHVNDQWVYYGLLALLVWAPLPLGSNRTWAIGILLAMSVLLFAASINAWRQHFARARQRLALFRWPLFLLLSMVLLSWLQTLELPANLVEIISPQAAAIQAPAQSMTLSLDLFQSKIMASLATAYFLVFVVALLCLRNPERLDRTALVLVYSGVLQTVVGALLFSIKADYRIFYVHVDHSRMIGTYVYHNSLAGYLCMCLSIGIGLMLARLGQGQGPLRNWRAKVTAVVSFILSPTMRLRLLLVVMVIGLVLTRSRMGNSAFFAAMLIVGLAAIALARKTAPRTIALITSLIVIDIFVVGAGVGLEKVIQRIQDTEVMVADEGRSESIEARTEAARISLPIVQDYPMVGTGGGSFYNVFMSYRTPTYGYVYIDHTHNDFVEIATDYGLVGFAILGVLAALTLATVLRVMARRKSRVAWGIAFGVAMAIVGLFIHSTVDFNLQIPANALTIVVILAMGWVTPSLPRARLKRAKKAQEIEEKDELT
jgi:O-antigen ligase